MPRLLLTWSDRGFGGPLPTHQGPRPAGDRGPVGRLVDHADCSYAEAWVLTLPKGETRADQLCRELEETIPSVRRRTVSLEDPSDYVGLFEQLSEVQEALARDRVHQGWDVDVLLSSGTPQAQTLWVIMVQAGLLPARMLQVIPPSFVPVPHAHPVREVHLDIEGFPDIRALRAEVARLRTSVEMRDTGLIGESSAWRELHRRIARVASAKIPVLVQGETGTGKERVAQAVHRGSERSAGPFVAENCGALDEGILASELFGHEAGAFTGAQQRRRGLFEQAHGGTLFLDEVGEMPPRVQASLLRVLQEGTLRRVGGEKTIRVDVRVIAATHRDLRAMAASGEFREDLYYRLVGATLSLPPLRERIDDLALLIGTFLQQFDSPLELSPSALRALERYAWPGNVRELQTEVTRWTVFCDGRVNLADLSDPIRGAEGATRTHPEPARTKLASKVRPLADEVSATEASAIRNALTWLDGNLLQTARALGIDRNTLKRKIHKHGLG